LAAVEVVEAVVGGSPDFGFVGFVVVGFDGGGGDVGGVMGGGGGVED